MQRRRWTPSIIDRFGSLSRYAEDNSNRRTFPGVLWSIEPWKYFSKHTVLVSASPRSSQTRSIITSVNQSQTHVHHINHTKFETNNWQIAGHLFQFLHLACVNENNFLFPRKLEPFAILSPPTLSTTCARLINHENNFRDFYTLSLWSKLGRKQLMLM